MAKVVLFDGNIVIATNLFALISIALPCKGSEFRWG